MIRIVSDTATIIKRLQTITVMNITSAVSLDTILCSVVDVYLPKVCDPATKLHDVTILKNTVFSRIIRSVLSGS
jgi:hypothetical protein